MPFKADGVPYFAYFQEGKLAIISQSYASIAGRDNGIKSTTKNMKIEKHYRFEKHGNGKYYFGIMAANGQEVATSTWFSSGKSAQIAADIMMGKRKPAPKKAAAKKAAPKKVGPKKAAAKKPSNRDIVNYQPLAFFERHTTGKPDGIETFKGDDGEYYFTYNENGSIVLISEGYPTIAARDNGAVSVMKNISNEARYSYKKLKHGKHDFRLKAGNHQEIARSRWYGSAAAAATGAAYLMGKRKRGAAAPVAAVAAVAAVGAVGTGSAAAPQLDDRDDDYLKCSEYRGHTVNDKVNNDAFFKHKNGQFYFVLYDDNGDVRLRSESFRTAKERD